MLQSNPIELAMDRPQCLVDEDGSCYLPEKMGKLSETKQMFQPIIPRSLHDADERLDTKGDLKK